MNKRIKEAVETLGLTEKTIFTIGELEQIAALSGCKLIDVMRYLRRR